MPKKQTYINSYFKSVQRIKLKFVIDKESVAMNTPVDFNSIHRNTLNGMKEVMDKINLKSVKLPFLIPRYGSDSDESDCEIVSTESNKDVTPISPKRKMTTAKTNEGFESPKKRRNTKIRVAQKRNIKKSPSTKVIVDGKLSPNTNKDNYCEKFSLSPVRKSTCIMIGVCSPNKILEQNISTISSDQNVLKDNLDDTIIQDKGEYISTTFLSENITQSPSKIKILDVTSLKGTDRLSIKDVVPPKTKENDSSNRASISVDLKDVKHNEEESNHLVLHLVTNIVQYVGKHNTLKKLLTCNEATTLNRFFALPNEKYIFFCIRLYTRIRKWYDVINLSRKLKLQMCDREVMDMYKCLSEEKFVDVDYSTESITSLLEHLSVQDLKDLCAKFKLSLLPPQTKHVLIEKLLLHCGRQSTLTFRKSIKDILLDRIKDKMGPCIKINTDFYNTLNKVHFLYSFTTNDFETTSDLYFFLSRIRDKTIVMPQISINENYQIFSSISSFRSFQKAHDLREDIIAAIKNKRIIHIYELSDLAYKTLKDTVTSDIVDDRPLYIQRFTCGYQYTRALSTGAQHLKKHYPEEVNKWLQFLIEKSFYCKHLIGLWYNLLIMVQCNYLKQREMAIATLIEALQDTTLSKIDLIDLNIRAERIKNSTIHKISRSKFAEISKFQHILFEDFPSIEISSKAKKNEDPGRKRDYFKKSENGLECMSVEQVALKHYFTNGFTNGIHCEGTLLVTIFFVLFWDIIYGDKVPSAFISEIQYFPLDLFSPQFYVNRQEDICKRLSDIEVNWSLEKLKNFICDIWTNYSHIKSCINVEVVDEPKQLFDILLCIGRLKVSKIMEHFAKDFSTYRAGLPDLFLWDVNKKMCKFVEVKGENDKLSSKQKCWLDFLRSIGGDIEVCYVRPMGSSKRRKSISKENLKEKTPKK